MICPNCESLMEECGECPECDHQDDDPTCSCEFCEEQNDYFET